MDKSLFKLTVTHSGMVAHWFGSEKLNFRIKIKRVTIKPKKNIVKPTVLYYWHIYKNIS